MLLKREMPSKTRIKDENISPSTHRTVPVQVKSKNRKKPQSTAVYCTLYMYCTWHTRYMTYTYIHIHNYVHTYYVLCTSSVYRHGYIKRKFSLKKHYTGTLPSVTGSIDFTRVCATLHTGTVIILIDEQGTTNSHNKMSNPLQECQSANIRSKSVKQICIVV